MDFLLYHFGITTIFAIFLSKRVDHEAYIQQVWNTRFTINRWIRNSRRLNISYASDLLGSNQGIVFTLTTILTATVISFCTFCSYNIIRTTHRNRRKINNSWLYLLDGIYSPCHLIFNINSANSSLLFHNTS